MNKSPQNGNWYTEHTEQMFLIIVLLLLILLFFIFRNSHSSKRGNKCTFFWNSTWPSSQLQAALNQCGMADNFPHDRPPPYASLLLTQHIPHSVVIQLYTDPFPNQVERALLGQSPWLIPSRISNVWPRRWPPNICRMGKRMEVVHRAQKAFSVLTHSARISRV